MDAAYRKVFEAIRPKDVPRKTIQPLNRLETGVWEVLWTAVTAGQSDALLELRQAIASRTGTPHVALAPSCRAAITNALSFLPQPEVVIPAYTCPVVRSAAQLAGKRIIYVDVAENQVNATSAEFEPHARPGRILVPTHLYGVPTDIEAICDLARARDCITIEDAAGCFGGMRNGRALGSFGDIGVFSFARSKRLPAFRGGAVVVNRPDRIDPYALTAHQALEAKATHPWRDVASTVLYNLSTPPWLYGRLTLHRLLRRYAKRPAQVGLSAEMKLRAESQNPRYLQAFHPVQAALVLRVLGRLEQIRAHIEALAETYNSAFRGTSVVPLAPTDVDQGDLLRFPVVFPENRETVLAEALKRGHYLEVDYETPLPPAPDRKRFPHACAAAEQVTLLPLYGALPLRRAQHLAEDLAEIAG